MHVPRSRNLQVVTLTLVSDSEAQVHGHRLVDHKNGGPERLSDLPESQRESGMASTHSPEPRQAALAGGPFSHGSPAPGGHGRGAGQQAFPCGPRRTLRDGVTRFYFWVPDYTLRVSASQSPVGWLREEGRGPAGGPGGNRAARQGWGRPGRLWLWRTAILPCGHHFYVQPSKPRRGRSRPSAPKSHHSV